MSSNAPWAPQQGAATGTATEAEQPQPSAAPQELIDENDPRLTSEAVDVNVEGDAYARPAPPPDAKYRVKLKLQQVEVNGQKRDYRPMMTKKAPVTPYFATGIEARILDPSGKYDNIPVFDNWVGTMLGRDGSTKVQTILTKLKQPNGEPWVKTGVRLAHKEWIDTFVKALAGEPEIGIETQWGWQCQACGEEADAAGKKRPQEALGMNKFPQERDPVKVKAGQTHVPEMKCEVNKAHGYSRAQVRISRFLGLHELPKA